MNKVHCNIIQDIIPLYVEDLCSEETRQMVKLHVAECEKCGQMLAMAQNPTEIECALQGGFGTRAEDAAEKDEVTIYHKIRKQIWKKAMKIVGFTAAMIVCVVVIIFAVLFVPISRATYEQAKIAVVEKEEGVYIDSYIYKLDVEIYDDTMIVSGRISNQLKIASKNNSNMYRSYKHLDESIDRIVFEDRSGEIYELWERE